MTTRHARGRDTAVQRNLRLHAPFGGRRTIGGLVLIACVLIAPVASAQRTFTTSRGVYDTHRELGSGNQATVYAGRLRRSGQPVAIRVAREYGPATTRRAAARSVANSRRFVHVIDESSGGDGRTNIDVMELLEHHVTLLRYVPENVGDAVRIVSAVLDGLEELHGHGFVHRDIRPKNVMVDPSAPDRDVRIIDFGLAENLRTDERRQSRPIDLHDAAALLTHLLTGEHPKFWHEGGHVSDMPRLLRRIDDLGLRAVLRRALSPDESARYQSAPELRAALAPFLHAAGPLHRITR